MWGQFIQFYTQIFLAHIKSLQLLVKDTELSVMILPSSYCPLNGA